MSFPSAVGRYRIDRALGSGAFASVWLGHDDALDSMVAIKVLNGSLIDDLDVRNRFLEEARILRRADSERLVRVHDIGELPDGRPYFVMSYADRGTLADRMRRRPLPVAEALRLAEATSYGVEVINTLGVIHRDLKPSNVLFQSTPDGGEKVLIADLGLAKALAHASGAFTLPVGTPGYMSPEQARFGGGLDVRADVYGLGALTFHMLTGRPPGQAPIRVPPSELREGLPAGTDEVVLRALEVEREKRWPTAEAFGEALAELRAKALADEAGDAAGEAADGPSGEPPATVVGLASRAAAEAPATVVDVPSPQRPGVSGEPDTVSDASYSGVQDEAPEATVRDHSPHHPYGDRPPGSETLPPDGGADDDRTTEMHLPSGQAGPAGGPRSSSAGAGYPVGAPRDSGEATILDRPAGRFAEPARPPAGNDGKTSVFSSADQHYEPGPGQSPGPGGHPFDPGQSPGPGGHPYGPGPGPGQSAPPQGYPPYQPQQSAPQPPPGASDKGSPFGRRKKDAGGSGGGPGGPSGPGGGGGGGGDGGGDRRRYLTPLLITAAVLAVALVGGLALGTIFSKDDGKGTKGKDGKKTSVPADFVKVTDDSGKITASVPKAWPKAGPDRTWLPSGLGFAGDATARPVLRATPDVAKFRGVGTAPGVFVGLTTAMPKSQPLPPGVSTHSSCTKGAPEEYASPDKALTGTILRFTGCKTGTPLVTEVALHSADQKFGAWVRIRQTDNADIVKPILDNLKLQAP
ncbi:serine/threonine-protein kinase [Actinomadura logoneensis]|uniref:serine/threonine-protein kinase n=1 Tax=Actinomadura logoneensis TaxID=2293572 RepID=UPI001F311039|nr:serine/threonine-protein kinase [Actinomadura logoneensis]